MICFFFSPFSPLRINRQKTVQYSFVIAVAWSRGVSDARAVTAVWETICLIVQGYCSWLKLKQKSLHSADIFLDQWVVHRNNNGVLSILFSVMLWTPRSFAKSSKPSAYTNSHEACMKRMHEHATAWIQIYCAFWCGAKCPHRNTPRSLNFFWRQFSEGIGTCRRKSLAGKALTLCLDASVSYSDHLIAMAEIRDNSGQRDGAGLWRN